MDALRPMATMQFQETPAAVRAALFGFLQRQFSGRVQFPRTVAEVLAAAAAVAAAALRSTSRQTISWARQQHTVVAATPTLVVPARFTSLLVQIRRCRRRPN